MKKGDPVLSENKKALSVGAPKILRPQTAPVWTKAALYLLGWFDMHLLAAESLYSGGSCVLESRYCLASIPMILPLQIHVNSPGTPEGWPAACE